MFVCLPLGKQWKLINPCGHTQSQANLLAAPNRQQGCWPAGMSSSLLMTTLLVGMSCPTVDRARGEADMSATGRDHVRPRRPTTVQNRQFKAYCHVLLGEPSELFLLRTTCQSRAAIASEPGARNPRVFISAHFCRPSAGSWLRRSRTGPSWDRPAGKSGNTPADILVFLHPILAASQSVISPL